MLFSSTWEIDMGMMEIASFTDPCEEHFHIFMPSSFPLKAVKGGLWILHGTQRLMRSPLCVKMDQWNKTRKLLAELRRTPEWDDSRGGQWDRRWVGVNSKRESVVVPLYLLPLLFFIFFFDFCWPKSTWGHLLTDGSFYFHFAPQQWISFDYVTEVITAHSCLGARL